MIVHYRKSRAIRMMVSGSVLTLLYLFLISRGHSNSWMLIPSVMIFFVGYLYLQQPYFELREQELVVFSLIGKPVKRYPFEQLSDFEIQAWRVYVHSHGKRQRVRISRIVAAKQDWERFTDKISGHDLTHELHNI